MPAPEEFIKFVDDADNQKKFIETLKEAVAYHSVSGDPDQRQHVIDMGNWLKDKLDVFTKFETQIIEPSEEDIENNLPPVIKGRSRKDDPNKKTILIYNHYDVMPASKDDQWDTIDGDPFNLTAHPEPDGRLVGRGSTDDKGPIIGWLNVLKYHHDNDKDLPVNLRYCFEGMEENGSQGLDEKIKKEAEEGGWFYGVDAVCICDNYWLGTKVPALTNGLRGIASFEIVVSGPKKDLHSGTFGGMIFEPMTDLIQVMGRLVDSHGRMLIPGIYADVAGIQAEEEERYKAMQFTVGDLEEVTGPVALSDDRVLLLMNRMRNPCLSLHGIEGAWSGPGPKTIIPSHVKGKFSIRLVPNQTPEKVNEIVKKYLKAEFDSLLSRNVMEVNSLGTGMPWVADANHWNFQAGRAATQAVYNQDPELIREGGSIPVTLTFAEALKPAGGKDVNVMLLPMGRGDDGAHSNNEKLDRSNFINGTKLLGTYLYEVAAIHSQN